MAVVEPVEEPHAVAVVEPVAAVVLSDVQSAVPAPAVKQTEPVYSDLLRTLRKKHCPHLTDCRTVDIS